MAGRVLLVDDDEGIRDVIEEFLMFGGHDVLSVSNGGDGLNQLDAYRPDLVITDLGMPNMNGYEFSQSVKEKTDVPIMMMTGVGMPDDADQYSNIIDTYLSKPISLDRLLEEVDIALSRRVSRDFAVTEIVG